MPETTQLRAVPSILSVEVKGAASALGRALAHEIHNNPQVSRAEFIRQVEGLLLAGAPLNKAICEAAVNEKY